MSDPTKQMKEKTRAVSVWSMPSSRYWRADIVDEKNTMNEQVAAVTCKKEATQHLASSSSNIQINLPMIGVESKSFVNLGSDSDMEEKRAYQHTAANTENSTQHSG